MILFLVGMRRTIKASNFGPHGNLDLFLEGLAINVKASKFGPHGNFGLLFQKGLLSLKRVLQK